MRIAALVVLAAIAFAGDGDAARRKFLQTFTERTPPEARIAAIHELAASNTAAAARTLLDAWDDLEREAARARRDLHKVLARLREIEASRLKEPLFAEDPDRTRLLQQEAALSAQLRRVEAEEAAILASIALLRAEDAVRWLEDEGLARATAPVLLQTLALHLSETREQGVAALLVSLESAKKPEQIVPLLNALAKRGKGVGVAGAPTVIRLLLHDDWAVRAAGAHALAAIALPECVEPLVDAMPREKENSRGLQEFTRALQILTGQGIGPFPDVWARWLHDNRDAVRSGRVPLGRGKPAEDARDVGRFYGIPQDALRIVYVFDISGSMQVSMTNPVWVGNDPVPPKPGEESRINAAKKELLRAVKALRAGARFAVLCYSDHVYPMHDELMAADEKSAKAFESDLADVEASGSTNIYAAMDAALRLAGVHPDDPAKEQAADAIFLVSDGSPTTADGKLEDPQRTLLAVRQWNALRRVVIHTIGIGKEHSAGFLRAMAQENGGRYFAVSK